MWSWPLSSFSAHPLLILLTLLWPSCSCPSFSLHMWLHCGPVFLRWSHYSCPYFILGSAQMSYTLRVFLWPPIQTHKCSISSCPVIRLSSLERSRHRHGVWDARCLRGINASAEKRVEAGLREEMELWFVELGNQYWPSEMAWGPIWQGFYSSSCLVLCEGCPRNTGRHLFAAEAGP